MSCLNPLKRWVNSSKQKNPGLWTLGFSSGCIFTWTHPTSKANTQASEACRLIAMLGLFQCAHNLSTHNLSTHNLLHTQLVHTQLTYTQLVHTQLTHTHNLSTHHLSTHNLSTHNLLTLTLRGRRGTWSHPP